MPRPCKGSCPGALSYAVDGMLRGFPRLFAALVAVGVLWPRPAHAEQVIATGAPAPAPYELDVRGPVQIGWGYSRLFHSRVLSLGFHDELSVLQLSRSAQLDVAFGMDGQRTLGPGPRRSFLATDLGVGLSVRVGDRGPLFVGTYTFAPLWHSSSDSTKLVGFGVGLRDEVFPFYQTLGEAVGCGRGALSTYVSSGLNGWVEARQDWMGSSGPSIAGGFGIDLGREVLLPILGAAMHGSCSQ